MVTGDAFLKEPDHFDHRLTFQALEIRACLDMYIYTFLLYIGSPTRSCDNGSESNLTMGTSDSFESTNMI